jgi:hypothetical protein
MGNHLIENLLDSSHRPARRDGNSGRRHIAVERRPLGGVVAVCGGATVGGVACEVATGVPHAGAGKGT